MEDDNYGQSWVLSIQCSDCMGINNDGTVYGLGPLCKMLDYIW